MALSFDIGANERAAVRAVKNLGEVLEDATDKLDDLARNGDKDLGKLESSFEQLAREARDAGRKVGDGLDDGFRKAAKGADDFKQEAQQTARESAASFDGSADSIADAFQEVAANAFSGFGPLGAAAGIAAAAGLGTALSAINQQQEAVDALKEKFRDAYQSAAEDGRTFLNEAEIQSLAIEIFFDPAQRAAAQKDAEKLGVDLQTAVRAQAGDQDALAAIIEAGNVKIAEGTERMREKAEAGKNVIDYQTAETANLETLVGKYQGILDLNKQNEQAARDVQQLKRDMSDEEIAQIQRTRDADQQRWEAFASAAESAKARAASPVRVPLSVDLSQAYRDVDAFIANQSRRRIGIAVGARGIDQIG